MKSADQVRKSQLAQIHVAKAQLNMADDVYRGLLMTLARVDSAADLDDAGRRAVLNHFKKLGFVPTRPKSPLAKESRGRLLLVLWRDLKTAGKVNDGSEAALTAYIKNHTKVDRIEWLTGENYNAMIEQLKQWLGRK